jgi:hypothetical protein
VAVLSLVTYCWEQEVLALRPRAFPRRYVDDLVVWERSAVPDDPGDVGLPRSGSAEVCWWTTVGFARDIGFKLNEQKTSVFATCPSRRRQLRGLGPPVDASFRDLGVGQRITCGAGASVIAARVRGTLARFERIRGLPLTLRQRVRFVVAAGMSAATFGAAAGPPPLRALNALRTAASRALGTGGRFGAPEVRLLLADPSGRADPVFQFVAQPLLFLVKAYLAGWVRPPDLEVDALSKVGAGHGLLFSFRQLRLQPTVHVWTSLDGEVVWRPFLAPYHLTKKRLLARWRDISLEHVAERRQSH